MMSVIVKNLDIWSRKVASAPGNLNGDTTAVLEQTAAEFAEELRSRVPVLTGALRDTIKVEGTTVSVGSGSDYAGPVEWGHMDHGTHVPPQPFFVPTLRVVRKTLTQKVKQLPPKAFR